MLFESQLREMVLGTRMERPARAFMEWRRPVLRRDRLDNERLTLLIDYVLREDSCAVDVGAHQGLFLREMVRVAPRGRHVAFEALPELAGPLALELPTATVHQVAVGAKAGSTTFLRNRDMMAWSCLADRADVGGSRLEPFEVEMVTLDETLTDPPALIKIDVEGAEGLVLEGARETLRRHRPVVWFEHGAEASRGMGKDPEEIYDLLADCGMRIFDVDGGGPYTVREFVAPPPMIWTFIAR